MEYAQEDEGKEDGFTWTGITIGNPIDWVSFFSGLGLFLSLSPQHSNTPCKHTHSLFSHVDADVELCITT
jgi:hypothetical protein